MRSLEKNPAQVQRGRHLAVKIILQLQQQFSKTRDQLFLLKLYILKYYNAHYSDYFLAKRLDVNI